MTKQTPPRRNPSNPGSEAMADSLKRFDRDKPFKRINNERFLVTTPPDGKGRLRGCLIPEDFGEFDKEFQEMIKQTFKEANDVFGFVDKVLDAIRAVLKTVDFINTIFEFGAQFVETNLGDAGKPIAALIRGAGKVLSFLNPIGSAVARTIDKIIEIIQEAFHKLFEIIGKRILNRAVRMVPRWVPVRGAGSNNIITADEVVEVEGIATRSFGNPIEVPFFNWHFWFNWNIQVKPEPEYVPLLTPGLPNPVQPDTKQGGATAVLRDGSIEIQWDAGGLASDRGPYLNGFPESQMDSHDGPITNGLNCWPMTGMLVWAAGRWVYDCCQATAGTNPLMRTMINPPKALATARWQAFRFDENTHDVPAIQFMFLAASAASYLAHATLNDTDYEFVVDLPPIEVPVSPFPIGHRPDFLQNTIVVRPRLLKKLQPLAQAGAALIEPEIEPIPPDDPSGAPKQVKVKIPAAAIKGTAAGFLLSMGWFDPNLEQARRVKFCEVSITGFHPHVKREDTGKLLKEVFRDEIQELRSDVVKRVLDLTIVDLASVLPFVKVPVVVTVRDVDHLLSGNDPPGPIEKVVRGAFDALLDALAALIPSGDDEWLLHFGFNGRWRSHFDGSVTTKPVNFGVDFLDETIDAQRRLKEKLVFTLTLAEGDPLFFSCNGMEVQPVGNIMHSGKANRTIRISGRDVPWREIVKAPPGVDPKQHRREIVFQYVRRVLFDTTTGLTKVSLGMENFPLGLIDPDFSSRGLTRQHNPMMIKDVLKRSDVTRRAGLARSIGDQHLLVEEKAIDYEISYHLEIRDTVK